MVEVEAGEKVLGRTVVPEGPYRSHCPGTGCAAAAACPSQNLEWDFAALLAPSVCGAAGWGLSMLAGASLWGLFSLKQALIRRGQDPPVLGDWGRLIRSMVTPPFGTGGGDQALIVGSITERVSGTK